MMTLETTVTFNLIDVNHNMIALMYGIEAYDRLQLAQAIAHRHRYWHDHQGQPRRNPTMRPLLHNGRKPR